MRWFVAAFAVGVALVAILFLARGSILDRMALEQRHQVIALVSRFTAPAVNTADDVKVLPSVSNPVGVNTFLEQEADTGLRRRTVEMIRDAGIGWMRQQFPWDNIEPVQKGRYIDRVVGVDTWEKYDAIVALAEEYGPRLIVRLDTSPPWARPGLEWPASPPEKLEDYGDFVESVARRYRGRVQYYQIWNEPNLTSEWGHRPVNAAEYVELLRIAHERIKRADPEAYVISAALAPTIEESTSAMNDLKYLDEMYRLGAAQYFDILSVQAYGLRSGPDDRRVEDNDVNFSRPRLIREVMVRHNDANKPIWAAEVGWNAQPESVSSPAIFGRVSEETQSRYTVRAFERAREEWPWMGVMAIWFFKRADYSWTDEPMYYFRMAEPDLTPRKLYFTVQEYTRQRGLTAKR
jgi:polysaccharide biosynthesis protein PslG